MASSGKIHVSVGQSWIAIVLFACDPTNGVNPAKTAAPDDKLHDTLRFRLRLPEIDDVPNPLIAHPVIGSQEQHGCSREHAP